MAVGIREENKRAEKAEKDEKKNAGKVGSPKKAKNLKEFAGIIRAAGGS